MIIGIFIGLLLLIMQEFVLLVVIGSLIFFFQALKKMLPESIKFEISNHGVMIGDNLYYWGKLRRYFFINREGREVLAIDTVLGFPGRIYVHFDPSDKDKIKAILDRYIHFMETEPRTFLDDAYDKILGKFNYEEEDSVSDKPTTVNEEKESVKETIPEE
jgi:hypothetical protein